MKDKEKQIENIALIIAGSNIFNQEDYINTKNTAKRIYELLLPEDSVIIPRRQYEVLDTIRRDQSNKANILIETFDKIRRKASRDTAEHFLEICGHLLSKRTRKALAEAYGVELKE